MDEVRQRAAHLTDALRAYQERHGLKKTGVLDEATVKRLNAPVASRAAKLRVNLERLRWIPRPEPGSRIDVNIASAELAYLREGEPETDMLAVAGKLGDETPMVGSAIDSIVLNPPWYETLGCWRCSTATRLRNGARDPGLPMATGALALIEARYSEVALEALAARLEPSLEVLRPTSSERVPVVVQMHGCGGVQPLQQRYGEVARQAGVAAVIVDSLKPRGIGRRQAHLTVCTGLTLRGRERALDLLAILAWLERQAWVDTRRVAVAGWSHGAWAVMDAFASPPPTGSRSRARLSAVKAAFLVYPYVGQLARTRRTGWGEFRPSVYACLAERDAVVGHAGPSRVLKRLEKDGCPVEVLSLPEATHCFDDDHASDPRTRFRPDLASQNEAFYSEALKASLCTDT